MEARTNRPPRPWALIIAFGILSPILLIGGYFYTHAVRDKMIQAQMNELNSITDMQMDQLVKWKHEKEVDATVISENEPIKRQILKYLDKKASETEVEALKSWMGSFIRNYDYLNTSITDRRGKIRIAVPDYDTVIGPKMKPLIPIALEEQVTILTDLHQVAPGQVVHLDLIVPLLLNGPVSKELIGLMILRIDPGKSLYPLLNKWSASGKTSETLLLRQEGDSVLYLSELRHSEAKALTMKRSIKTKSLVGAKAVLGFTGLTEGIDYRNEKVMASVRKIPDSNWFMVTKIDMEEVMEPINRTVNTAWLVIFLFIISLGALTGWTIWHLRVKFYRDKLDLKLERDRLNSHYDYVLRYANDIILLFDSEYRIVEANERACSQYQYTADELRGRYIMDLRPPELYAEFERNMKRLGEEGMATYETFHKRKNGTTFPIEISARIFEIEGKKYYQIIGRDISERKAVELLLNQLLDRYNTAIRAGRLAVWDYDFQKDHLIWDDIVFDLYGVDRKEFTATYSAWLGLIHPDDRNQAIEMIRKSLDNGVDFNTEFRVIQPAGYIRYLRTFGHVVHDESGKPVRLIGINYDITDQKEAEARIENSFWLLKATIESTADGLLVVDTSGKIVTNNIKFSEMWSMPQSVLDQKNDDLAIRYVLSQLKDPESFVSGVQELYANPERISFDTLEFLDGRVFERYSQPQKINDKIVGRVWSFRDITKSKLAEKELIRAKEKAEESDRLKTAFLHNISHEIRTPMNAIVGFSALLEDQSNDDETRRNYTSIIIKSTNQLLTLISDIVEISNIEVGQSRLSLSEVNINHLIRDLYQQFKVTAETAGIEFSFNTRMPDERAVINTDKAKLSQILIKLLDNSFKFTRKGFVRFGYEIQEGELVIYVEDSGIGIPQDKIERIFDRFFQVESVTSREFTGAGLGLSICKAYAELLGGEISVTSREGKGSEFRFRHPV